ncbi:MAG: hypothetical protein IPM46_08890 [Flavobacteriales bacterium]|nr:hypothetical protein [Flavobacteriales bacterium]
MLTVRWAARDSTSTATDVRYVFDFLARMTPDGVRLSFPIAHNTRDWERQRVGPLHYVISPSRKFSSTQAAEQIAVIEKLSTFFGVAPFSIPYYSFSSPTDLFRAKGFQHHVLMHVHPSGGMVDEGGNVYSGNNKDIYTHEIVHLFTHRKFSGHPDLLDEGLATLLGGSVEREYAWHRARMARFLVANPTLDLSVHCNTYDRFLIDGETSLPSMIGALLCERILRIGGKQALFRVFAAGSDPWPSLVEFGITKERLSAELAKEIQLPLVDVL